MKASEAVEIARANPIESVDAGLGPEVIEAHRMAVDFLASNAADLDAELEPDDGDDDA